MEHHLLDAQEAAQILRMDKRTLVRWARVGYVPAHPIGEGKRKLWRFREHELLAWVEARETVEKAAAGEYHKFSHQRSCKENSMSRFQQGSLLKQKRKSGPDVWVFRWYDDTNGTRKYKKRVLGTVTDMPLRRDAEKAVADFRANINVEVRVPQTVSELAAHYRKHELTADKKAFATIESTSIYLTNHVVPKWGNASLSDVRTVEVEQWLHSLPYAPATRSKIRNIMSAVFNHAIRHEWIHRNPITKVRASAKRLREPDVLSPAEFVGVSSRSCHSGKRQW